MAICQRRLQLEKEAMQNELYHFKLYQSGNDIYFKGRHITSTTRKSFQLKLVLPKGYPDRMPNLYVLSPKTLWKRINCRKTNPFKVVIPLPIRESVISLASRKTIISTGFDNDLGIIETINSVGSSHAFHTLSNGPDGCVQICHFKSEFWDASKTCVGVLFKGLLWLEAYDIYLKTDMSIASILSNWKRRQEWKVSKKEFGNLWKIWPEAMKLVVK